MPASGVYNLQYQVTDHLGNIRAIFADGDGNGSLSASEILQMSDYYPFGREMSYSQTLIPNPDNKYKYNDKEFQTDLSEYDYGVRFYDATIARWNVIDPKSDVNRRWSPYNYVKNSPVNKIDPDGMEDFGDGTSNIMEDLAIAHESGLNYSDKIDLMHNLGEDVFRKFGNGSSGTADISIANLAASSIAAGGNGFLNGGGVFSDTSKKAKVNQNGNNGTGAKAQTSQTGTDDGGFWHHLVGPGLIIAGQPLIPKAFVVAGSSTGTSIASNVFSKLLPFKSPIRLWAPVYRNASLDWVGTKVVGRFVGRWVPWVGWAITLGDLQTSGYYHSLDIAPNDRIRNEMLNAYSLGL